MKQIRILALLLALALCLAGCGSAPASSGASSGSTSQAQGDAAIPQEALDDVVSYLTDGAYAADDVVATVGDTAVTAAQALYWTAYQQYYMTYYYYSNYGMTFQMSDQMEDGTTVGQSLLDFGVDTAVAYAVAAQRAQDNGVSLSEENAAAREIRAGSFTAAELTLILSAPARSSSWKSSRVRMPPPTVTGTKTCCTVRRTTSATVLRASTVAVMSRKTISSAPCRE